MEAMEDVVPLRAKRKSAYTSTDPCVVEASKVQTRAEHPVKIKYNRSNIE